MLHRYSFSYRSFSIAKAMIAWAACGSFFWAPASYAKPESVQVASNGELSFGTFMVFGSGARSVSVSGHVTDQSIVALEGTMPKPARFTVRYDRGNESRRALKVDLELVLTVPAQVRQEGVEARLSQFETDLPGYVRIAAGEAMQISIDNCRTRVCSKSFNIGARLDVTRNYGGANVNVPIVLDARIVATQKQ